ncbi:MAG: hypothetical protein IKB82_02305 [Clostridia bacterium]|nr:hypothetical protein [Clostridia bacterium]
MDISGSCPRPIAPARPVRGPHGGWQQQEIDRLHQCVSEGAQTGESLRSVFERVAQELGRKPNSIRNFYYAQLREQDSGGAPRALPFETFAPDEVELLLEKVLTARAQGMSVRACVRKLSGGDKTRMLRYQNKYRSTVRSRPEIVHRVMERLSQSGVPYVSPYPQNEGAHGEDVLPRMKSRVQASGDARLAGFFDGLDHLLDLALSQKTEPETKQALPAPPEDSDAQRRADRLSARCDMLRIALADEQQRTKRLCQEAGGMLTLIREYIALPQAERSSQTQVFCQQAAARLAAVECAMMDGQTGDS